MENITEALQMAGAVLLFVIALSVGMYVTNQSRMASDAMLYATDKYEFIDYTEDYENEAQIRAAQKRKVGIETIIPTLYKYATEKYTIVFKDGTRSGYKPETGEFASEPVYMQIYYTTNSNYDKTWRENRAGTRKSYINPYVVGWSSPNIDRTYETLGDTATQICIFDEGDESTRQEIFRGSQAERKKFLDVLIYGGTYFNPQYHGSDSITSKDPTHITSDPLVVGTDIIVEPDESLLNKFSNAVFLEEIGEYNYTPSQVGKDDSEAGTEEDTSSTKNTKRIITYTLIKE